MKWSLFVFLSFALGCGCQSFKYGDSMKNHHGKDQFINNYENSPKPSFLKWQWERLTSSKKSEKPFQPEVLKTDMELLRTNTNKDTLTWIGHASTFLQIDGLNILIDPIFSERASPVSFLGPKRLVALPFKLEELPPIDIVLISHNHYDHLDLPTLKMLSQRNNNQTLFLVPLGNLDLLKEEGIGHVQEMDWWEDYKIKTSILTFVPAQHWSQRKFFDYKKSLWGGWHIRSSKKKILYTGDTGYSKDFSDIHKKLGDVDVAILPIGSYEPRWFMGLYHVNPEEALHIHEDVKAKISIGVHWGTFRLSDEPMDQPPRDLEMALNKTKQHTGEFRVLKHGETLILN